MKVPLFFKNKYVLYSATCIGILSLIRYISLNDGDSAMLSLVLFALSRYFSRNLTFNILLAVSLTYIVSLNKNYIEGFEDKNSNNEKKEEKKEEKEEKKEKNECDNCPEDKCVNGKCVSTFKNNVPSSTPTSVDGHIDKDSTAAKMEGAFNDLANLLGDEGVKSISKETKNLIEQQKTLMGTLNDMAPSLKQATETLENLNLPSMATMTKMFNKNKKNK